MWLGCLLAGRPDERRRATGQLLTREWAGCIYDLAGVRIYGVPPWPSAFVTPK